MHMKNSHIEIDHTALQRGIPIGMQVILSSSWHFFIGLGGFSQTRMQEPHSIFFQPVAHPTLIANKIPLKKKKLFEFDTNDRIKG